MNGKWFTNLRQLRQANQMSGDGTLGSGYFKAPAVAASALLGGSPVNFDGDPENVVINVGIMTKVWLRVPCEVSPHTVS